MVQTYRGYGSDKRLYLMGRVLRQPAEARASRRALWDNLRSVSRLMRAWGIEGAELTARFADVETAVKTDADGYFCIDLDLPVPPPADRRWHQVAIRLNEPVALDVEGDVFIPGNRAGFVVISDIDDTVMHTGVANKLVMMWRLFVHQADSRTAFPGMASFLGALHRGQGGADGNPMLYVSRAPWAIYGVLERFFNLHDIPVGPILFLREWGLTLQHPFPKRGKGHKTRLIKQMIAHYDSLPFILIGDSGQRDPEIYAEIVRRFPERVIAIYIRDVSSNPKRDDTIKKMATDLAKNGVSLILASDTEAMARHAAKQGWIAEDALTNIAAEIVAARDAA